MFDSVWLLAVPSFTGTRSFESSWGQRGACWGSPWHTWHWYTNLIVEYTIQIYSTYSTTSICGWHDSTWVAFGDEIQNNPSHPWSHRISDWGSCECWSTLHMLSRVVIYYLYNTYFASHVSSSQNEGTSALAPSCSPSSTVAAISCG